MRDRHALSLCFLALVALALMAPPASAAADSTAIAQLAARFHAEERFNGALLVAAGDEVVYEGGFGEADHTWGAIGIDLGDYLRLDRGRYTVIALGNSDSSRSAALAQGAARILYGLEPEPANILGTAVAWRMVRDGVEVAEAFFHRQRQAGYPDYFDNDFAFSAYCERFLDSHRPDLALALAALGLEAHPESAGLHLASAESLRALGDPASALAAAEKTLALLTAAGEEMGGTATRARALVGELEAETRRRAAGE